VIALQLGMHRKILHEEGAPRTISDKNYLTLGSGLCIEQMVFLMFFFLFFFFLVWQTSQNVALFPLKQSICVT